MSKIIGLLTDFGTTDSYNAIIKGVIYTINPEVNLIDLTHDINPQDIESASWILNNCYNYFPKDTIFLGVVDPGVGSKRKALLIKTKKYFFITPDNGILSHTLKNEIPEKIISLDNPEYWLPKISNTFHARDIFAPVAAHLSKGDTLLDSFGTTINIDSIIKIETKEPIIKTNQIIGHIVYIDRFGNLITNISEDLLKTDQIKIKIKDYEIKNLQKSYNNVDSGRLLSIIGSHNCIEISAKNSSAEKLLNTKINDKIILNFLDD